MASIPLLTKPSSGRPPFNGGPTLTTFAPDPEENPDYLVERVGKHVLALEKYARQSDADPDTVLDLLTELYSWIEHLLSLERTLSPTMLPPGNGALYSLEYLLDAESNTITAYKRYLDRLDEVRPLVEAQAKFKRLLGFMP